MTEDTDKAASTDVAAYQPLLAELAELEAHNATLVFEYHTKTGGKEARSHVAKLRKSKTALDTIRKAEKKEALEYGRKVDGEAQKILTRIETMIDVHAVPLAKIKKAEDDRIAGHRERLAQIEELGSDLLNKDYTAEQLRNRMVALHEDYKLDPRWEEFLPHAEEAMAKALAALGGQIERQDKYEAEQAELAELREKQEAQEQKDRDDAIRREAADSARREAEAASYNREQEALQKAEEAERARVAAEVAREAAESRVEVTQITDTAPEVVADKEHQRAVNANAKGVLVDHGVEDGQAEMIMKLIITGMIPNVSIVY